MVNRIFNLGHALWLLFISFFTFASEKPLLFVAEDLPPYHFVDDSNQPKGALVEVVKALQKYTKSSIRIEIKPFARGYSQMEHKPNVFMFSLLKTPHRANKLQWIGQTYRIEAFLVGLKGREELAISKLDEAKQYIVGTIRGYYSQQFLEDAGFNPEFNLSLSVNYQQMWHMLLKKRIDYILTNNIALGMELASINVKRELVVQYFAVADFPSQLYIATSLLTKQSQVTELAEALNRVKSSGEYQSIINSWGLVENASF